MEKNPSPEATLLRERGLKATPARLRVLSALAGLHKPAGIQELSSAANLRAMDTVTLYRALDAFMKAGLVREVNLRHGHADYELADWHHHHAVCTSCGTVEDLDWCPVGVAPVKRFAVIDHALELFGLCRACVA